MTTYAVVGSNCFTGSHIVDALLADPGNDVIGVSRSPEYSAAFLPYRQRDASRFRFHQLDIVRRFGELIELLDAVKPHVVIHVAALSEVALSHERPVEYFDTNTLSVVKLCDHLRRRPYLKRYVQISSAEVFGSCDVPATEETLFHPSTPYAASKAAADMYLETLIRSFDFPATLIRSTNVYGAHQQLYKIIPRTILYLKQGKPIELHGGGRAKKSFIHIRDVVDGLLLAIDRGSSGTYHFSVPSDQTVVEVVRQICGWMGHEFERATRIVGERLGQDTRYWLDCSKAEDELGWKATMPFEDGVKEVIEWIEREGVAMQREPLVYVHK